MTKVFFGDIGYYVKLILFQLYLVRLLLHAFLTYTGYAQKDLNARKKKIYEEKLGKETKTLFGFSVAATDDNECSLQVSDHS